MRPPRMFSRRTAREWQVNDYRACIRPRTEQYYELQFLARSVGTVAKKIFEVQAYWSTEGNDWCAVNDELPVAAEAPTLDALIVEVKAQAAEMAELNGLVAPGEEIELRLVETVEVEAFA